MTNCDRCGKETRITIMSMFNTDVLCVQCKDVESSHPDYDKAREAEAEAVRSGNRDFPGVGWPGVGGRLG